jgi:hypothetical protein
MLAAPKPFASLSSGLLARKGQARPAMRRQLTTLDFGAESLEDLGWNDMGEPLPAVEALQSPPLPPVLAQREELAGSFADAEPQAVAPVLPTGKRRAAFTLRLDPERHLRLRLAAVTRGVSAQKLVTEALDQFLKTMPELEPLAASASGAK